MAHSFLKHQKLILPLSCGPASSPLLHEMDLHKIKTKILIVLTFFSFLRRYIKTKLGETFQVIRTCEQSTLFETKNKRHVKIRTWYEYTGTSSVKRCNNSYEQGILMRYLTVTFTLRTISNPRHQSTTKKTPFQLQKPL